MSMLIRRTRARRRPSTLRGNFLRKLQDHLAESSITNTALRNQGASGVVQKARDHVKALDLRCLALVGHAGFVEILDRETTAMLRSFPHSVQGKWGSARKAINLFLRSVVYNRDLCEEYRLRRIRSWLEVPLDKDVAIRLKDQPEGGRLPKWLGLGKLSEETSVEYQNVASIVSRRLRVSRVDLDVFYWRSL